MFSEIFIRNERGFTFPLVLFTVIILVFILAATVTINLAGVKNQVMESDKQQAYYMAESGLVMARYFLNENGAPSNDYKYQNDAPWLESKPEDFNKRNSYKVWLERDDSSGWIVVTSEGKRRIVLPNGLNKDYKRTIRVTFTRSPFPDKIIETTPGRPYYVESYRWDKLEYSPPTDYLPEEGLTEDTVSGDHKYTSIELENGQTLNIQGPANIQIKGDIELKNGSTINISGEGPVNIYLEGDLTAKNGSSVVIDQPTTLLLKGEKGKHQEISLHNSFSGKAESARYFLIKVATSGYHDPPPPPSNEVTFEFKNKAHVVMALFAPNSTVKFKGSKKENERILGAVVVREASATGNKDAAEFIEYDPELKDITFDAGDYQIVKSSWSEL